MTRRGLVAFLLGAGGIAQAQGPAERWVNAFQLDHALVQVDRGSVQRAGSSVTLRSRILFNQVQGDGTKILITLRRFDCSNRTTTPLSEERRASDGRILSTRTIPAAERRVVPVVATSANAHIFQAACNGAAPGR